MGDTSPHNGMPLSLAGGTTPVPTALLDRAMPQLRDTELRVLLVVVRQTLGWQVGKDPYLRKERDWLTQSQLMRRTGRASGAVARAVDALVRHGLIDVLDAAGRPLPTPAERRRQLGRLYYRLHTMETGVGFDGKVPPRPKSEHAKPHTTRKTEYKNRRGAMPAVDKAVDKPLVIRNNRLRSSGWVRAGDARMADGRTDQRMGAGGKGRDAVESLPHGPLPGK